MSGGIAAYKALELARLATKAGHGVRVLMTPTAQRFVGAASFDVEAAGAWFETRGVARFKTPERVVVVDSLPVLPTGKPDRDELRARLDSP